MTFALNLIVSVGYLYAYYSNNNNMRISRFTLTASNIPNSEKVIYNDPDGLQGQIYHFGGDLSFGPGEAFSLCAL